MSRPKLLDLFCGAGGAAMGYHLAGFDVVGVDKQPQPNYCGDEFIQADALDVLADREFLAGFDAIHASPPCQAYSVTASLHAADYPRLIGPVRDLLRAWGGPFVIENVEGARRDLINPIRLCGSYFDLGVRRHRLFEVHPPLSTLLPPCAHYNQPEPIDVTGTGGPAARPAGQRGGIHRKPRNLAHARAAMGIGWMSRRELAEAIPPAYTTFVGEQLISHLSALGAAS